MNHKHYKRYKLIKDFGGEILKLTLIKIQKIKDKEYDLFMVCKVVENEQGEEEFIKLYPETFTPEQEEAFYKYPTYYEAYLQNSEETWGTNELKND